MIDRTVLTEALEWWVELVADLEPDTETFTVTMSRAMAERTLAAIDQLLDFPTDQQVEAARLADHDYARARRQEGEEHPRGKAGYVLEAVRDTMIGEFGCSISHAHRLTRREVGE